MGSKVIVSDGQDMVVEHLDAAYKGVVTPVMSVSGTSGNVSFKDADGNEVFGIDHESGVISMNGQAAIGTTGTNLALSGTLSIVGTTTLGAVSLTSGKDIVAAGGASDLDMSLSSGIFKTPSGQTTLTGAVAVSSGIDIVAAGGASDIDYSLSSGVFKAPTGLATMAGDVLLSAGKVLGFGAPQALTGAGAVNVTTLATMFTSSGAGQALTLANGTRAGQLKIVHHTVDGGSGVLTPTTAGNFATFTLTAVHDACLLMWNGSSWDILLNIGGTIA